MSAVTAKVAGITLNQKGNIATIGFDINGKVCTAKAYPKEYGSDTDAWTIGESYQIEFEKKTNEWNGKTTEETWAKKVKAPRSGGGGRPAPKADPERNQIEKEKVEVEKAKQEQFERKWEIDRQSDRWKSCSIVAQVAAKIATEITVTELGTLGGEFDPSKFKSYVSDIATAIDATTTEIYSVQTSQANRSGQ